MSLNRKRRAMLKHFESRLQAQVAQLQQLPARVEAAIDAAADRETTASRVAWTATWITGTVAVLAAGIYVGREIRSRYKFKRRTPYDLYAHSGDRSELEFGVGI